MKLYGIQAINWDKSNNYSDIKIGWIITILVAFSFFIFFVKKLFFTKKNNKINTKNIKYILFVIFSIFIVGLSIFLYIESLEAYGYKEDDLYKIEILICIFFNIFLIIMQFIYVHNQEEKIIESNQRKIINLIFYYLIETIIVIVYLIIIVYSLVITKINKTKVLNEEIQLYNTIKKLDEIESENLLILVENNNKYGFINEQGHEIIRCQYEKVSNFYKMVIDKSDYYIALAKKDNKYNIISKNNDFVEISNNTYKSINQLFNKMDIIVNDSYNFPEDGYMKWNTIVSYIFNEKYLTRIEEIDEQIANREIGKFIELLEKNQKYYYIYDNYQLILERLEIEDDEVLPKGYSKCNVTIKKENGEEISYIDYIYHFDEPCVYAFTDGYIRFREIDKDIEGFYDINGNKRVISGKYEIVDVIDNNCILNEYDDKRNFIQKIILRVK